MTLYLDATRSGELFFALRGTHRAERTVTNTRDDNTKMLRALTVFLADQSTAPAAVRKIVVAAGPGRFSSLRVSAAIANIFRWAQHTQVFSVRMTKKTEALYGNERVIFLQTYCKRVQSIRPLYGLPPSITRSKRVR